MEGAATAPAAAAAGPDALTGQALRRAAARFQADAAAVLSGLGLRPNSHLALCVVAARPDLRPSQLARALEMERSNVVPLVDALLAAGLIERRKVPEDRRSYALRATRAGCAMAERATLALRDGEARLMSGLSAAERAALTDLLRRVAG